jgi:hypothetical protein
VCQLSSELLTDEVALGLGARSSDATGDVGYLLPQTVKQASATQLGLFRGVEVRVVGVDAERTFLIDVAVTHRDDDGIYGNVHHDDVEDKKADPKGRNRDDGKASGPDGKSLE